MAESFDNFPEDIFCIGRTELLVSVNMGWTQIENHEVRTKRSNKLVPQYSVWLFLILLTFGCTAPIPGKRGVKESPSFQPVSSSSTESLASTAPTPSLPATPNPNIILIVADDLGYGDLGSYGQKTIQTPHLDKLAEDGIRFTQFYSGSTVCAPSRCVLMTGFHTGNSYIRGNGGHPLPDASVTVAEVLKSVDYTTGCIGKWGLGREGTEGIPTKQGFDNFFGYLHQGHAHNFYPEFLVLNESRINLENVVPNPKSSGAGVASVKSQYSHDLFIESSLSFLDIYSEKPFFLYLPFTIPHANNEAKEKGMEIPDFGQYADKDWPEPQKGLAAMITHLDAGIGQILAKLDELGISDNTLVLFTSDNGPHAEGGNDPDYFDSNGPLRGIKRDLYEGGIRVPLIARWPAAIAPGQTSNHIASFQDILPTLAEITDAQSAVPGNIDGISFVSALTGNDAAQVKHPYLYWEFHERGGKQAIRMNEWKAIYYPSNNALELFNLLTDPEESNNLAASEIQTTFLLKQMMEQSHSPSPIWNKIDFGGPASNDSDN